MRRRTALESMAVRRRRDASFAPGYVACVAVATSVAVYVGLVGLAAAVVSFLILAALPEIVAALPAGRDGRSAPKGRRPTTSRVPVLPAAAIVLGAVALGGHPAWAGFVLLLVGLTFGACGIASVFRTPRRPSRRRTLIGRTGTRKASRTRSP